MKPYNPIDVCHYCNDRMYEYLKQKILKKIKKYDDGIWFHTFPQHTTTEVLVAVLKSLLEEPVRSTKQEKEELEK